MTPRRVVGAIRWYLREVSGEADYDRYLTRAREHPGAGPVLSRREFERRKTAQRESNPTPRCC